MPPLTRASVHTDAPMGNFVVQFGTRRDLPAMVMEVTTENDSDEFFRFEQNNRRVSDIRRADGTRSSHITLGLEKASFSIDEYALHTTFGPRLLKNEHPALRLMQRGSVILDDLVGLEYEYQIFTLLTTDANYGTGHSILLTDELDDYINGDPLGVVAQAKRRLLTSLGGALPPGARLKLCMGEDLFDALCLHPDIVERMKYTRGPEDVVTEEILAAVLRVQELVVSRAAVNVAAETPDELVSGTDNTALWPSTTDKMVLAVVGQGVGNSAPTVADFTAFGAFRSTPNGIRRWENNQELGSLAGSTQFVEAERFWDLQIVAVDTKASGKSIGAVEVRNCLT